MPGDRLRPHLAGGCEPLAVDTPALDTVEAIADALLPTLPPRFWLAGFSFGGYVALAMLEAAPERVQGIAMICTAPGADSAAARARREAALQTVADGGYFAMIDAQAAAAFHPDSLKDASLMAERQAMVRATMARPDRTALLDGSRPTLVVGGAHDALFPPKALAYADAIPGCQRHTVDGAAHLVPMEQPAALASCLKAWMKVDAA